MLLLWSTPLTVGGARLLFVVVDGLTAFRAFLKTEFSDENIEFWMACEDYKKIKSSAKLASRANKIYREFIEVKAPREVRRAFVRLCVRALTK